MEQHATLVLALAGIIQALTAGLVVYLTARLARATDDYARHTRAALDHAQNQFELAKTQFELTKTQFEREWLPQLHISVQLQEPATELVIRNLSKNSVLVTHLILGTDEADDDQSFTLDLPIEGIGRSTTGDITPDVRHTLERYVRNNVWAGLLRIRLAFT